MLVTENLVAELMGKVEKEDVSEGLKSVHFIKLHLSYSTLRFMKGEDGKENPTIWSQIGRLKEREGGEGGEEEAEKGEENKGGFEFSFP